MIYHQCFDRWQRIFLWLHRKWVLTHHCAVKDILLLIIFTLITFKKVFLGRRCFLILVLSWSFTLGLCRSIVGGVILICQWYAIVSRFFLFHLFEIFALLVIIVQGIPSVFQCRSCYSFWWSWPWWCWCDGNLFGSSLNKGGLLS